MGIANAAVNAQTNNDEIDNLINALEKITVNQLELGKTVNQLKKETMITTRQKKIKMRTSNILSRVS